MKYWDPWLIKHFQGIYSDYTGARYLSFPKRRVSRHMHKFTADYVVCYFVEHIEADSFHCELVNVKPWNCCLSSAYHLELWHCENEFRYFPLLNRSYVPPNIFPTSGIQPKSKTADLASWWVGQVNQKKHEVNEKHGQENDKTMSHFGVPLLRPAAFFQADPVFKEMTCSGCDGGWSSHLADGEQQLKPFVFMVFDCGPKHQKTQTWQNTANTSKNVKLVGL